MNGPGAGRRVFGPFVVVAVSSALLLFFLGGRVDDVVSPGLALVISFGVALLSAAWVRATRGPNNSAAVMLLCATPYLVALALTPAALSSLRSALTNDPDWIREPESIAGSLISEAVRLRGLGARLALSLLLADAITLARFGAARSTRQPILFGLLLALPFQVAWAMVAVSGSVRDALTVGGPPLLALALLPLSLARGGAQTGRILLTLTLAQGMVSAFLGQFVERCAFGFAGCTPASRLTIVQGCAQEVFPFATLEVLPWLPGALALAGFALLFGARRNTIGVLVASVALFVLDAGVVARLGRLVPEGPLSSPSVDFVPRGQSPRTLPKMLRVSEAALLRNDGTMLARSPLVPENEAEVDEELKPFVSRQPLRRCWRRDAPEVTFDTITISLDARLSNRQFLEFVRIARGQGVEVIRLVEGEGTASPSNPYALSTHLERAVAGMNQGVLVVDQARIPRGCTFPNLPILPTTNLGADLMSFDEMTLEY